MHAIMDLIEPVDLKAGEQVRCYLDTLTKPPGSLGELEALAIQLGAISGRLKPCVMPPQIVIFAADHGVAEEGVSAFPQAVTAQMVANFANGGAAINVFSRQISARIEVVDVGVASTLVLSDITHAKVRAGTANIVKCDAMEIDEAVAAIDIGVASVERAYRANAKCMIIGEMGIANTTASSALLAALTGVPVVKVVGAGTGISGVQQAHKVAVIERALQSRAVNSASPLDVLAKLGGLEIAAMVGAYLASAAHRLPAIVDGFIATVAALVACRICPAVQGYLIFSHRSEEPGHSIALHALNAEPLLSLKMRLGEGSGAALAFPLLQAASAMLREMATFADAGVTDNNTLL